MDWITPLDNIEELTQGTIVGNVNFGYEEDLVGIVLSNGCDLEHNHASYLIIAALYPASSIISSSREYLGLIDKNGYESSSSRQKTRVKEKLSDYIHHRAINRYYFIFYKESSNTNHPYLILDNRISIKTNYMLAIMLIFGLIILISFFEGSISNILFNFFNLR